MPTLLAPLGRTRELGYFVSDQPSVEPGPVSKAQLPQLLPHSDGKAYPVQAQALPTQLRLAWHLFPQLPQLLLSVLVLVQTLLQKFGLLAVEQPQLPTEHVLPGVVQSMQLEAEPQLWLSIVLS